jgi:hypothetical protein
MIPISNPVASALALFAVAGCQQKDAPGAAQDEQVHAASDGAEIAPGASAQEASLDTATVQRIDSLVSISRAIEAFKADHGAYPNSGGGWTAYKMSWGASKGENWIPELVPNYLPVVPREPTKSEDPDGPQFLYASDGQYYKLIAHYTGDCERAIKSPRVKRDPVRIDKNGECWAYGIWSPNGEQF